MTKLELAHEKYNLLSVEAKREAIIAYELFMLSIPTELRTHIEPVHYFSEGIYAREVFVPKGTILTGAIHLTEHLCVVSKGDITIWSEFGVNRIKAPYTFKSIPGTKRLGFAHEDTVCTTFHVTDKTNPEEIMSEITTNDYSKLVELNGVKEPSCRQ
jgi:hypothetical protein